MNNRRSFIKKTILGLAASSLLPTTDILAGEAQAPLLDKPKLRFALASDGHYAQPGTDFKTTHSNIVKWLNAEHEKNHLDFVIINGDLVHNRPDLLPEVKREYFDKIKVPFYAIPGNHDHADTVTWKSVFGYEDNYSLDRGDIGFVLANTSNVKGEFLCPDNAFLKRELDKFSSKKVVFVVLHIPPHKWVPEDIYNAECAETLALLHQYRNVKAVFHGHDHNLDTVRYTSKLPHFFDGHFGGNWGLAYAGYRVVEVGDDMAINTYQVNASKDPILNTNKIK
ncbi:MAG: metallophosphoesterase [Sphingobacteriaceae bacterium]|jgi:3',5'-cyclic AMP phosphodiesterase CpdA|nr:metallophosphoesterase [Sphingobacteriaceae bacterium]